MRRANLLSALAAALLVAATFSGCVLVDSENNTKHDSEPPAPNDCCREVEVCKTICDDYGCYDECEMQTKCADSCQQTCHGDLDCPANTVCQEGVCAERNFDRTGTGGLCQSCETAYDCAEPDSRCVRLYFDRTPDGGPKVCATDCESEVDCPLDFECVDEPGTPRVCVPDEELGSTDRVCPTDLPDGVECFSSENCDAGESCIDNECVAPDGECTDDSDCGQGAKCRNFRCVESSTPECLDRTDCASNEVCVNGQCESRNPDGNCIRNSECEGDAVCVDGSCLARCANRSDCNSASEICRQGLCVPIECRFNSDCGGQEVCVDAQCRNSCEESGDCSSGYVCATPGGYCKRDPNVECRMDEECLSDEACQNGTCTQICNCNQQCPSGEVCNMEATSAENTGLCESPDMSTPPECGNDCDCPSGEQCVEGTCKSKG